MTKLLEQAHMAGQYFAGTDPSYSEAHKYCAELKAELLDLELINADVIKHECARIISMYCGVDASDKIAKAVKEINVVELLNR